MIRVVTVHDPAECAKRFGGVSIRTLVALLKAGGYAYTALSPEAKPWGVGRQLWGMTDEQIARAVDGQARKHAGPPPPAEVPVKGRRQTLSFLPGHDGVSRLKLRKSSI